MRAQAMDATNVTEITQDNFKSIVDRDGIVLIDWWAPWCGPCRTCGPTYERVAEKHADITFGKVNTEEQQALAASFEIRSIPTLMILRDKVMLYSEAGALPEPALEDLIKQVRGLDMEVVRAKLAAREAAREAGGGTK